MIGEAGTGFRTALATLDHTRITIAAQAIGIAQGALDYAVGYVKQRSQFGQAIAEFQGVQFMLADMAMKLEAAARQDRDAVPQRAAARARSGGRGSPGGSSPSSISRRSRAASSTCSGPRPAGQRHRRSPNSIGSICKPILRHWPWDRHPRPANMVR
jgi:alkylation response protein AidB-like acyl-CoA dehydrogenase